MVTAWKLPVLGNFPTTWLTILAQLSRLLPGVGADARQFLAGKSGHAKHHSIYSIHYTATKPAELGAAGCGEMEPGDPKESE